MKIGIYGFGAIGIAIYYELREYKDIYVLADQKRIDKYTEGGIYYNDMPVNPKYLSGGVMDVVIVCVKNYSLKASLKGLEPFVGKNTVILPLLNGIDAHDVIKDYFKYNRVLWGVINIEANKNGNKVVASKIANLQYGDEFNYGLKEPVITLRKIFNKYNINNNIYQNMKRRVWLKWLLNMGINQYSALYNATYYDMAKPEALAVLDSIYDEVYLVSKAYNIGITKEDLDSQKEMCRTFKSNRVTSLTLDVNKGGENELDYFGLRLIELAKEKNISVPVTTDIYNKLKNKI